MKLWVWFLGLIGAGIFALVLQAQWKEPRPGVVQGDAARTPSREAQRIAAIVACQSRVRASLKAPSTAQFPHGEVRDKGYGVAVVISHVDSQNSFGAMQRTHWLCEVDVSNPDSPRVHHVGLEER